MINLCGISDNIGIERCETDGSAGTAELGWGQMERELKTFGQGVVYLLGWYYACKPSLSIVWEYKQRCL